jgi:hypothetical protein
MAGGFLLVAALSFLALREHIQSEFHKLDSALERGADPVPRLQYDSDRLFTPDLNPSAWVYAKLSPCQPF